MTDTTRRDAALKLLEATGIWRSHYLPPYTRLLWRLGFDVPPPHFLGFWRNALSMGLTFGVTYFLIMELTVWRDRSMTLAVLSSIGAAVFFGLVMAAFYARGRRKHGLPRWDDLPDGRSSGAAGAPGTSPG